MKNPLYILDKKVTASLIKKGVKVSTAYKLSGYIVFMPVLFSIVLCVYVLVKI